MLCKCSKIIIIIVISICLLACSKDDVILYRDSPQNEGVINAYKKAHQFSDIVWQAKKSFPTAYDHNGFSPDVMYTGLWYSSVKETNKFIGYDVSLTTAMTALNNPYSLIYSEDISKDRNISEYGNDWHGTNCGAYMGVVCSSLVAYALGFDVLWSTKDYPHLCDMGILTQVNNIGELELMDIIYEEKHVSIITDIWRDENKNIMRVEITEAIHDNVVSRIYNIQQLRHRLSLDSFISLYRYEHIQENDDYEPSPFVAVKGEVISEYKYNNDICTYAGDYASFRSDEKIVLNYTKGEYTQLEIYNESELIQTITLSADANNHKIDLDYLKLNDGLYKARLTNSNKQSEYTHFEIRDISIQVSGNSESLDIIFDNSNIIPSFIDIVDYQSYPIAIHVLTSEEREQGQCSINLKELATWDNPNNRREVYIKVAFLCEYGKLYNRPIKVTL